MKRKAEETRWTEAGFVIRRVSKGKPYQVDEGTHNGKRTRKRFATLGEARTHCNRLLTEIMNKGTAARDLSDRDRMDAGEARRLLGKTPILDAVQFYLQHHSAGAAGGIVVDDLIAEYLKAPGRRGRKSIARRERTVKAARNRLAAFAATFGERKAAEITRQDVEDWLTAGGWTGLNARNYLANARALFAFAVRREWQAMNPAEKVELPADPESKTPPIMPPAHVRALLTAAVKHDPTLVPRLAIAFFAGVRAAELDRLDWSAVDLSADTITIEPAVAKMRRQRHVTVMANLHEWLLQYREDAGPVWALSDVSFHHRAAEVARKANVEVPSNAGRHAFASYHLAQSEDAGKTALQLGHARPDLLLTVYRNIRTSDGRAITKETAKTYFDIRPDKPTDAKHALLTVKAVGESQPL